LEWGTRYIGKDNMYSDICTDPYVMHYKHTCGEHPYSYDRNNSKGFCADIHNPKGVIPEELFDLVLPTQVFEHLYDPYLAAQNVFKITRPGGMLVLTAPQISVFHGVPDHFFGYTVQGIRVVLEKAGFCVLEASGLTSTFACASNLLGFAAQDMSQKVLE